jgi:hypothetical protein
MLARVCVLLLALAGPAYAQSMQELYVESERARLVRLREEARALMEREPKTDDDLYRLTDLRLEIRRTERRLKALEEPPSRP